MCEKKRKELGKRTRARKRERERERERAYLIMKKEIHVFDHADEE